MMNFARSVCHNISVIFKNNVYKYSTKFDMFADKEVISLRSAYSNYVSQSSSLPHSKLIDRHAIFANGEVDLSRIEVYGFDYDYTLATYTTALNKFIFDHARSHLIEVMDYPKEIYHAEFDPNFAIRGLHYDVRKGLLMKVDAYHTVELDSVYRGLRLLPVEEAAKLFHGPHIPKSAFKNNKQLAQLMDFFIIPEMNLLAHVINHFISNRVKYVPEFVHDDVTRAVRNIHLSGVLHNEVADNPTKYINFDPDLSVFLRRLKRNNKTTFLLTNSNARFIDKGMDYLVGPGWKELFDVVIVSSNKPSFFQNKHSPFKPLSSNGMVRRWQNVTKLQPGHIYEGGNFHDLKRMTEWDPSSVMYFGDHVYSDLADLSSDEGWSTGCIVPELEYEISVLNSSKFRHALFKLNLMEKLIYENQYVQSKKGVAILEQWLDERRRLRKECKACYNSSFGSIFRTVDNPSHFSQRINQYAAVYTSNVTNFLKYKIDHKIFPHRITLPHEFVDDI